MYIVTQLTSREEKAELMEAFQALDKNKDGKISPEELLEAYNNTNNPISEEEIEKIVSVLDADGSGYIDYSGKKASYHRVRGCCLQKGENTDERENTDLL